VERTQLRLGKRESRIPSLRDERPKRLSPPIFAWDLCAVQGTATRDSPRAAFVASAECLRKAKAPVGALARLPSEPSYLFCRQCGLLFDGPPAHCGLSPGPGASPSAAGATAAASVKTANSNAPKRFTLVMGSSQPAAELLTFGLPSLRRSGNRSTVASRGAGRPVPGMYVRTRP
jgi:hypothetical protein